MKENIIMIKKSENIMVAMFYTHSNQNKTRKKKRSNSATIVVSIGIRLFTMSRQCGLDEIRSQATSRVEIVFHNSTSGSPETNAECIFHRTIRSSHFNCNRLLRYKR